MQWFKHDTDASQDSKIRKLVMRHGAEGYAIYFHCLELIAGDVSESNITFELEHDAEIIADNLKIKGTADESAIDRVNRIMRGIVDLGLFEESHGKIFCFKLLKRMDTSMTSSKRFRALISKAKEQNHDRIMIGHDSIMQEENRKEETRLDKNKTEDNKIENADKQQKKSSTFSPPSIEEVEAYCKERNNGIDAVAFVAFYEARGWMMGKTKMKNWRSAVITWERNDKSKKPKTAPELTPEERARQEEQWRREEEEKEQKQREEESIKYFEMMKQNYRNNPQVLEKIKKAEERFEAERCNKRTAEAVS